MFPHNRALTEPTEMEEERRLAYVGITRAQQQLHLSHAWSRQLFGTTNYNPPSRFLDEIPADLVESSRAPSAAAAATAARATASNPIRRPAALPSSRCARPAAPIPTTMSTGTASGWSRPP